MNTKPRISIILTILSILSLSMTTARAQNLVVSNSAVTQSGTHYENNGTANPALTVSGSLGSFTGTNIILTGTSASGNGRFGAYVLTQGKINLTNSTINSVHYGIYVTGTSSAVLNNINVSNTGATSANAYGIYANDFSTLSISSGTIHTSGQTAHAIAASLNSSASLNNISVITDGTGAFGLYANASSTIAVTNAIIATNADSAHGIGIVTNSVLNGSNVTIATAGNSAYGINSNVSSTFTLASSTITTTGYSAAGIVANSNGSVTTTDVAIATTGSNANGIYLTNTTTATITGGTITTQNPNAHGVYAAGISAVALNNVNISTREANAYGVYANTTSAATLNNVNISTNGVGAYGAFAVSSTLTLTGGTITTIGTSAQGLFLSNNSIGNAENTTINVQNAVALRVDGGTLTGKRLTATSAQYSAIGINGNDANTATLTDSNLTGGTIGIALITGKGTGNVTINGGTLAAGADLINANASNATTGALNITLNNVTTSTGTNVLNTGNATTITLTANNTPLNGDLTSSGSSTATVTLNNSTLTGKTTVSDTATLNLSLFYSGTWYMVDDSTLTNLNAAKTASVNFPAPTAAGTYHTLTVKNNLGGEGGTFAMHTDIAAHKADLLSVGGTASTGAHRITLTNANDNAVTGAESPLLLVETAGGSATFTGTTTAGVYDYSVQNGAQLGTAFALPDTNWYLYRAGISNIGNAIINTSALLGYDWFYSLDALYLRMGDVREENLRNATGAAAPTENRKLNTENSTGNLWLRGRGYRLNADASLSGHSFNEYAYGLTAGADKAFHRNTTSTTLLGGFLDAGRIDRDFSGANNIGTSNNTGYTTSLSAGLYATYLRQNGWHADLVLKADRYKHHFDTTTADHLPVTGDYTNNAFGASLEIGRRLQRADGWWVEPMVQAAYTWLQSADYRTGPAAAALGVTVDSVRAAQYRALVRFGRHIQNSRWLPYGKFGVVKTDLTGGALHIADGAGTLFVPDCDGWRVEFGAGTSYRITQHSQLYFDYEYDRAPHYERPWALNLGYRYGW